ncbi:hypothetical protein LCGC14_2343070, partial [marine sediment metagenome]
MARSSDLEKGALGFLGLLKGFQRGTAADRDFQQRVKRTKAVERTATAAEKRTRIAEFTQLQGPLEQLERGQQFGAGFEGPITPGQQRDVDVFKDFVKFKRRRPRGSSSDPGLSSMTSELGQLRRKSELTKLTPREEARINALEGAVGKRTGLGRVDVPEE